MRVFFWSSTHIPRRSPSVAAQTNGKQPVHVDNRLQSLRGFLVALGTRNPPRLKCGVWRARFHGHDIGGRCTRSAPHATARTGSIIRLQNCPLGLFWKDEHFHTVTGSSLAVRPLHPSHLTSYKSRINYGCQSIWNYFISISEVIISMLNRFIVVENFNCTSN